VAGNNSTKPRRAGKPAAKQPAKPDPHEIPVEEFEREGMGVAPKE
jgi:hypothetical protein